MLMSALASNCTDQADAGEVVIIVGRIYEVLVESPGQARLLMRYEKIHKKEIVPHTTLSSIQPVLSSSRIPRCSLTMLPVDWHI